MLTEIRCSEFISKGQPRPPVEFTSGLNTVLGDHTGSNSIGKSTFLMIVDFVFGGDDYVDKSKDVQRQVGGHTIQFAFKFQNQLHFFSRDTITHNRVSRCNAKYEPVSEMSIDDFRKLLFRDYAIALPSISFRDIVTRYFRIYRRENLDENHPLRAVPQEREEESIASLVKLFGMHAGIEELRRALKEAKEKSETFKRSIQYDYVHGVTTKKQVKDNETRIRELNAQLGQISGHKDTEHQIFLEGLAPDEAQRYSSIKRELAALRQQKKAPLLTFENGRKYVFETPDDTGTGTSYKGLVLFDMSILSLTALPALVHDSVVLKQIADAPLERILELYQVRGKQVFIALDKVDSYPPRAQELLEKSAVLHLSDKGNELFGRSWNVKE